MENGVSVIDGRLGILCSANGRKPGGRTARVTNSPPFDKVPVVPGVLAATSPVATAAMRRGGELHRQQENPVQILAGLMARPQAWE
jgi:hypothetical protein